MKINQLTSEEIALLQLKANSKREEIYRAVRENREIDWVEQAYQATRIEVWIQVQKGNNPSLREHLEALPEKPLVNENQKTSGSEGNPENRATQRTRRYEMEFIRHDPHVRAAIEHISERSKELRKPLPTRIKWK